MLKDLRLVLLLDYYGELLTEKQRSVLEYYYCDDLSLAEIAEGEQITRQAVRDSIKRGEQQLLELEDTLHFAARCAGCKQELSALQATAEALAPLCTAVDSAAYLQQIQEHARKCEALL